LPVFHDRRPHQEIEDGPSVLTLPARHPIQIAKTYCHRSITFLRTYDQAVGSGSDVRDLEPAAFLHNSAGKL